MYYAGICIREKLSEAVVVVAEKVLRNAKKEYHVQDIRFLSFEKSPTELVSALRSVYDDDRFLRKKKVFSQNRRPPKNTYTPPLLMMSALSGGAPAIHALRDNGVPVDAVFFDHADSWSQEDPKVLRFGTQYRLHPTQMEKLKKVLASPLITLPGDIPHAEQLREEMDRCLALEAGSGAWPDVFGDDTFRILPSFFLILWHCETIRQIKRY